MIVGKIDRKLKLYKQTFTTNEYGERVVASNTFVTIYGDFDFRGGKTSFDADALINEERIECLIRYRTDIGVTPQYYISNGTTNYSIKSIKEVGRKEKMILLLEKNDVVDLAAIAPTPVDPTAWIFTINTANLTTGSTTNTQFKLPLTTSGTYNFSVDWGDDSTDTITTYNQAEATHTYATAGTYTITCTPNSSTLIDIRFASGGDRNKMIDISQWGSVEFKNDAVFFGCNYLNVSATDAPTFNVPNGNYQNLFRDCYRLNGPLNHWDMSNAVQLNNFFQECYAFNHPLNDWDTGSVERMDNMFIDARSFNQPIDDWDTGNVTTMKQMFFHARNFNQPLTWDTGSVTDFFRMFRFASAFDQQLLWDVSSGTDFRDFIKDGELSTINYDATLEYWAVQDVSTNETIDFGDSEYGSGDGANARAVLINDKGWTIIDGGPA